MKIKPETAWTWIFQFYKSRFASDTMGTVKENVLWGRKWNLDNPSRRFLDSIKICDE